MAPAGGFNVSRLFSCGAGWSAARRRHALISRFAPRASIRSSGSKRSGWRGAPSLACCQTFPLSRGCGALGQGGRLPARGVRGQAGKLSNKRLQLTAARLGGVRGGVAGVRPACA